MTTATAPFERLTVPPTGTDDSAGLEYRNAGFVLAAIGLVLAVVTLIANIAAANADSATEAGEIAAWSFGLTTLGFGTIKLAISLVLIGILHRLYVRVRAVKSSLLDLKPDAGPVTPRGNIETEFGAATETTEAPERLGIHKMARRMWLPMVAMGYMIVAVGFVLSLVWSGKVADGTQQAATAWTQGLQFLGEGFLLAGISFLLGTILSELHERGGEIQQSAGVAVRTLEMPLTARLFVGFLMVGLMVSMAQFVLYIAAATVTAPQSFAAWSAWLGPFREFGLGALLVGIVLALVTIGNVLAFQFSRIREIVVTGK